jgi:UDP-N-acetylglucosamine/UDP-N-acetylgalactosamine diphosphorylase
MDSMKAALEKLHLRAPSDDAPLPLPTEAQVSALVAKYARESQEHVFNFWALLSAHEQAALYRQLETLDPARVTSIAEMVLQPSTDPKSPVGTELEPIPAEYSASTLDASPEVLKTWRDAGLKAIAQGSVAVLLMAGGQGTRLGSSAPKGCYDVGLPSEKSLFQLQAERLIKLQELAAEEFGDREVGCVIPWYIMTSGPTRKDTEEFLKSKNYFGLKVHLFEYCLLLMRAAGECDYF